MDTPITDHTEFGAIDIGKNVNWLRIFRGLALEPVCEPLKVRTTQAGLAVVTAQIDARLAHCDRFYLALEPTGIYHENWARALADRYRAHSAGTQPPPLDFRFLNPYRVKLKRQQLAGRNTKTDPLDLIAMAHCLRDGVGYPAWYPTGVELQFQEWIAAYYQAARAQRLLARTILTQLDRLWPGALVDGTQFRRAHPELEPPIPIVQSHPLERERLRTLLDYCPNPYAALDLGQDGLMALLRQHIGRCGPATAQRIRQVWLTAVLPAPEAAAVYTQRLQAAWQRYHDLEAHLSDLQTQAEALVPQSPAAVLDTIPGVSAFLAARYLAAVGHHRRFPDPDAIWRLAGFDVLQDDSGDRRRAGHISKRGDPTFRDTLYLIGWHTSRQCPPIQQARQRALDRGLGDVGATLHAAHKANRLCGRLLYDQSPYDPQRHR